MVTSNDQAPLNTMSSVYLNHAPNKIVEFMNNIASAINGTFEYTPILPSEPTMPNNVCGLYNSASSEWMPTFNKKTLSFSNITSFLNNDYDPSRQVPGIPGGMKISQRGIDLIKKYEGFRENAYKCAAGKWTIGWGHTAGVKSGDYMSQQEADDLFLREITRYENPVNKVGASLNQNQFDALVSFCYNLGPGHINDISNYLRASNWNAVTQDMLSHNHGGGVVLEGLTKRRKEEVSLFSS